MKITLNNIKRFLKEEQFIKFQAILFYGNNIGLARNYITSICDKFLVDILPVGQKHLSKVTFDYSTIVASPDLLLNEIRSLNFFGDKKIIVINEASGAISKQLEQMLLEKQDENILIIFCGNRISTKDQIYKFFVSKQNMAAIPCYLEESSSIKRTLLMKLEQAGIRVESNDVVEYIASNIEGDSTYMLNEIDKIISAYKDNKIVTFQEIKNIISESSSDTNCDKYISLLVAEKFQLAESELKKLISADVKPHFIVKSLSRYFIKLYTAYGLIAERVAETEITAKLTPPIFFKNIPTFKAALRKYPISKVIKILEDLLKLEIKVKSNDTNLAKIILVQELLNLFYVEVTNELGL